MKMITVWVGVVILVIAFSATAEEAGAEGEKTAEVKADKATEACDCEQPAKPKKNPRYMIDWTGGAVIGGWFGPEVTLGTIGFDGGAFTAGITGGIELFGRVGIGLDLGYFTSFGDGTLDGWTQDDTMRGFYVGGIVGVVFVNRKFFSWGLDIKLDYGIMCRVNDSGDASGDPPADTGDGCDESTTGFILDPRFTFLFRVTRSFRFKLLTGYRYGIFDDSWTGPNKGTFGGIYVGLGLDMGKF
jgi:hypothetical protein